VNDLERAVIDLSIQVMDQTGGLDIHANLAVKALADLEARWGDAVRALIAARESADA
jgi:hypothetical protein